LKFLVGSAVSPEVAEGLRRGGHDAIHTVDCGLASASDEAILERAASEGRIVVTGDTDFGDLLARSAAGQPSIILFRRTSGKPLEENLLIARALGKPEVCEVLDAGGIIVVDPRRVRIRKLPIGSSDE
jgi:predicted nuclease of predicted toxin-antitoxin system